MTNLVIDIGNTDIKAAVFEDDKLLHAGRYQNLDINLLNSVLEVHKVGTTIISTVRKGQEAWEPALKEKTRFIYFNAKMAAGINNLYRTPKTLGADRLAGVIGANYLYPGKNNLVIDGGTCIKYDFIDADANYSGGSISPGLNMRYKALNYYTGALPLQNKDEHFAETWGNDTQSAITSGVQNGIKYELKGFIESYKTDKNELNIVLTGGDSIFFDTLLKNSIFAPCIKIEPHLVLKGLNAAIQKHND
jgi:type III pantothenate kinase